MQDCTRHTVRPGPANRPNYGQEPGGTRRPTVQGAISISVPFEWGTPLRGPNVNTTARSSAPHRNAPRRGDMGPIARTYPQQRHDRPTHCAARRAHPPSTAARPPLVRVRPDTVPRKAVPGVLQTTHPCARPPRRRRYGKLHRTAVRTSNLQEHYPLGQSKEGQVGQGYGGRRLHRSADRNNTGAT